MIIYDQTIIAFIQKSEVLVKNILSSLGIQVRRSRFLFNGYLYPIKIVVFDGKEWGHFAPAFYQIGLNKKLVYSTKESVLNDIIKHELAHYLAFLIHGEIPSHGREFHEVCKHYGFPKEISQATLDLEEANQNKVGDLEADKVLEKVKKLFQLAQSSNAHEAELATLKANSILLRHNLSFINNTEESLYLDRILPRKRLEAKLTAIQHILKHFMVKVVLSTGKNFCCLEISGTLTNVKLARYVADFLELELDFLWQQTSQAHSLKGLKAKNSFFLGVAKGFDEKMKTSQDHFTEAEKKSLVICRQDLEKKSQIIYSRLSHFSSSGQTDHEASSLGVKKGKNLNVRQGIESITKGLYLPF